MEIINRDYCFLSDLKGKICNLQFHLRILRSRADIYTILISNVGIEIGHLNYSLLEKLFKQVIQDFNLDPAKSIFIRLA